MLEATAPPELRDRELRRRLAETETEEFVALERLARLGAYLDETKACPANSGRLPKS